jgi:hypothetical protein
VHAIIFADAGVNAKAVSIAAAIKVLM